MTDIVLNPISSSFNISLINNNFDTIKYSINNDRLGLSGGNNIMLQELDMNSYKIINTLVDVDDPTSLATIQQVNDLRDELNAEIEAGYILCSALHDLDYPRVVAVSNGVAYYPDLTNPQDVCNIVGVTKEATAAGRALFLVNDYIFTEPVWSWSSGRIFCSLNTGQFTQVAPISGAVVEVGRAVNPTTIHVSISPGILRNT